MRLKSKISRPQFKADEVFATIYLRHVADEELLAAQHFLLVALRQVVEVGKLVEWRVAAREGRRRWQQQWVQRYELPYIQLTFPANTRAESSPTGEKRGNY